MTQIDLTKMKKLRLQKGFTLMGMSEMLGYQSPSGYHYLENGIRQIKAIQLMTIANKLGVDIHDLYIDQAA